MPRRRSVSHRDRIEYAAVRTIQAIICLLPAGVSRELGALLGDIAFSVFRIRRAVALDHLRRIFGSKMTEGELAKLARSSYRNFGTAMFEYARFPRLTRTAVERSIELEGREHLDRALEEGKGAILVAGHFGNWELFATLAWMDYPVTFLVGEQHNRLVDRLMNALRTRFGVEIVPLTGSLLGVFRALKSNRVVAMLSDQDAGRDGIFVEFLGLPASTPYGPGRFAAATGAAVLPGMVVRLGSGRHRIVICPPVDAPYDGASSDEAAAGYTQGYTKVLEEYVLEYPAEYFWMHRRWKTRPPAEPGRS